jgi:hypothetical protein
MAQNHLVPTTVSCGSTVGSAVGPRWSGFMDEAYVDAGLLLLADVASQI